MSRQLISPRNLSLSLLIAAGGLAAGLLPVAGTDAAPSQAGQRGQVHVAKAPAPNKAKPDGPKATPNGRKVYRKWCGSCHDGGFKGWVTGAPTTGDYEEWVPFFKKGAAQMTDNVVTGKKKHEKKGSCKTCDSKQIRAAVQYIIAKTPKR